MAVAPKLQEVLPKLVGVQLQVRVDQAVPVVVP